MHTTMLTTLLALSLTLAACGKRAEINIPEVVPLPKVIYPSGDALCDGLAARRDQNSKTAYDFLRCNQ